MTEYPISFRVEKHHIDGAALRDACHCPIARSLTESVGALSAQAAISGVVFRLPPNPNLHVSEQDTRQRLIRMTDEAIHFMLDIDAGKPVEPFTFTSTFTVQDRR